MDYGISLVHSCFGKVSWRTACSLRLYGFEPWWTLGSRLVLLFCSAALGFLSGWGCNADMQLCMVTLREGCPVCLVYNKKKIDELDSSFLVLHAQYLEYVSQILIQNKTPNSFGWTWLSSMHSHSFLQEDWIPVRAYMLEVRRVEGLFW